MKKAVISTYGMLQTMVNFTGLSQSTVHDWVGRRRHRAYPLIKELSNELVEAQRKVLIKWEKDPRMVELISKAKNRKPRSRTGINK